MKRILVLVALLLALGLQMAEAGAKRGIASGTNATGGAGSRSSSR